LRAHENVSQIVRGHVDIEQAAQNGTDLVRPPLRDSTRWFDAALALVGLIVLAPLLSLIALAVKISSRGPVFYRGPRVGKGGRIFYIYKFRSMFVGADQMGPAVTGRNDPRITPVGAFLRRYKLDELPQLLNVFKGDMAFVGPRPEHPRYVPCYPPQYRCLLSIRPGITSLASLTYRNEEQLLDGQNWETHYIEKILPAKLALEKGYFHRRTLKSDLGLILRTVFHLPPPHVAIDASQTDWPDTDHAAAQRTDFETHIGSSVQRPPHEPLRQTTT
jgi:lipopolysaccharide/colanic/teichoic acid biosynthesis glycosyltransferase